MWGLRWASAEQGQQGRRVGSFHTHADGGTVPAPRMPLPTLSDLFSSRQSRSLYLPQQLYACLPANLLEEALVAP